MSDQIVKFFFKASLINKTKVFKNKILLQKSRKKVNFRIFYLFFKLIKILKIRIPDRPNQQKNTEPFNHVNLNVWMIYDCWKIKPIYFFLNFQSIFWGSCPHWKKFLYINQKGWLLIFPFWQTDLFYVLFMLITVTEDSERMKQACLTCE